MTADFFENETDEYGWDIGTNDYPIPFVGADLLAYKESIQKAVEQMSEPDGNLMLYLDEKENSSLKDKVISAIPSVETRHDELVGCTIVRLKESLNESEMEDLQEYLLGQFSDGWGEDFEQHCIQTDDGILNVHFWNASNFSFEVEQVHSSTPTKIQEPAAKPFQMKLLSESGDIYTILSRASCLLRENGQPDQAKEMTTRVYQSRNYHEALSIISEYVKAERSDVAQTKTQKQKRSEPER